MKQEGKLQMRQILITGLATAVVVLGLPLVSASAQGEGSTPCPYTYTRSQVNYWEDYQADANGNGYICNMFTSSGKYKVKDDKSNTSNTTSD